MSAMSLVGRAFTRQIVEVCSKVASVSVQLQPKRSQWNLVKKPKPGEKGKSYRRIVHFQDKYTVEPLNVTNLAGRDPVTGAYFIQISLIYLQCYSILIRYSSNLMKSFWKCILTEYDRTISR